MILGRHRSGRLAVVLLLAALPVLIDPGAVARASALWPLAQGGGSYFLPGNGFLLYFWSPVVVLSAMCLVLAPGLLLAHGAGSREAGSWVLASLAISTVVVGVVGAVFTGLGWSPTGRAFGMLVAGLAAVSLFVSARLPRTAENDVNPWEGPANRQALLSMLCVTILLLVTLAPKFYWESFNGDGAHAYESGRLLLHRAFPFWPSSAGGLSSYPGFKTFLSSYPVSWYIRLFGELEASARLPYLLFLVGLYGGLMTLIDIGRRERAVPMDRWLPWLGLAVYTVVMAFSATYSSYHADLALPATEDTLCLAWFVGFAACALAGRRGGAAAFAALTYVTSPGGLILLGLWCGASVVVLRPVPWRIVAVAAGTLVGCMFLEALAPRVFHALGLPTPGVEHGTGALMDRLLNLQWRDWHRFMFLVLPAGILPALALFAWWRQDRVARVITLVALAQFGFFYLQARISLHYFVPAMVLPIAVLLRDPALYEGSSGRRMLVPGAILAALVALYISWPADPSPRLHSRAVGTALEDRLGGYEAMDGPAFARSELLLGLFPPPAASSVPDSLYGGSPLEWYYYANRGERAGPPAYVLVALGDSPPSGAQLIGSNNEAALYVLDRAMWETLRAPQPAWSGIAPVYRIQKRMLFHG